MAHVHFAMTSKGVTACGVAAGKPDAPRVAATPTCTLIHHLVTCKRCEPWALRDQLAKAKVELATVRAEYQNLRESVRVLVTKEEPIDVALMSVIEAFEGLSPIDG